MAKYQTKRKTVEAEQYVNNKPFEMVELRRIKGASGYNAKLAYYDQPDKTVLTIRPNEFVIKDDKGFCRVMTPEQFDDTYNLANGGKSSNNSDNAKDGSDNSEPFLVMEPDKKSNSK